LKIDKKDKLYSLYRRILKMPSACQQLTRAIIELAEFILAVLLLYAVYALPQPEWFSITFYIACCVWLAMHIVHCCLVHEADHAARRATRANAPSERTRLNTAFVQDV